MARHLGVISSTVSCYKSTRMSQTFEYAYICFLFIFSAAFFSLAPPSCIQFLCFSFGADYLILYRFSCTWLQDCIKVQWFDSGLPRHECYIMWIASSLAASWIDSDFFMYRYVVICWILMPCQLWDLPRCICVCMTILFQGRIKSSCRSAGPQAVRGFSGRFFFLM